MSGGEVASRDTRLVVDVHIHAIPASLVGEIERAAFPGVSVSPSERGLRFLFPGMRPSPPAPPRLTDFAALAERGRECGIDVQIVGPWTDLLGYTLARDEAAAWSQAYNEAQAAACADHPGLVPMATIPLQFPDLATATLERAQEAGCRGVMVGTDVPGMALDAPALESVWEAAAGLSMPILVHPTFLQIPERIEARGLKNAVARVGEITLAMTRLVYSGALLRHPELAVIAALGGGAIVPLRRRVLRNHTLGWSETDTDVEASLRRLYFDSVVLDPSYLRYLVREAGANRIVMGSDHPFPWEPDPVRFVRQADLSNDEIVAILGGTASALFGLA